MESRNGRGRRFAEASRYEGGRASRPPVTGALLLIAAVLGLVVGALIGHFVTRMLTGNPSVETTYTQEEASKGVVATYTYDGETYEVTALDALEDAGTLADAEVEPGVYSAPNADAILAAARNGLALTMAEKAGIVVTDETHAEYLQASFGTTDPAQVAEIVGMPAEQAERITREAATLYEYRKSVAPLPDMTAPVEPAEPEAGAEEVRTAEYAQYVISVAGDAWDASNGTWADPESAFAQSMGLTDFSAESADHHAARTAFYLAQDAYFEKRRAASQAWLDILNEAFSEADIRIGTLATAPTDGAE